MTTHSLTRRTFLAGTGLVGLTTFARHGLTPSAALAAASAKVGSAAPTFNLTATSGTSVSLADQRGKLVILEWTNHDCPYVRKHYDTSNMQSLQKETTGQGVIWLTLISSAPGTQGYVTPRQADELTSTRHASPTAVLLDPTGAVGKSYGATTCTSLTRPARWSTPERSTTGRRRAEATCKAPKIMCERRWRTWRQAGR
jgi:AhpC/TSA family